MYKKTTTDKVMEVLTAVLGGAGIVALVALLILIALIMFIF